MLKTSICSAYTGPNSFYPADCEELVGGQKVFASNATVVNKKDQVSVAAEIPSEGMLTPVTKEENAVVETPVLAIGGDGIVVDMKEEEGILSAPAHVSATGDAAGKVVMEMYWRAFWCVFFCAARLDMSVLIG
uniref:Uncharacterized protein n=1 Tax=Hyaloperonospora arabidopsidis (strain Emoy2) TaxID=559515 RepID=M4BX28_HYAAE